MRVHELLTRRCFALRFGAVCAVPVLGRGPFQFTAAETRLSAVPTPPVAPIEAKTFEEFGRVRVDPYYWLRNRRDPRVIALLGAENAYADARLEQIKPLVDELAGELRARATPEDVSVPAAYNGYLYQRRFVEGSQYPLIVRWKDLAGTSQEDVVLNVRALAASRAEQFQLGSWVISSNNKRLAFTVDLSGDREFRVFVRTLSTGDVLDEGIGNAASNVVFADDGEALFYVRNELKTVRPYQVWRHRVGSDTTKDELIYEETDRTFSVSIYLSKSRAFMLLNLEGEHTSEVRYLDLRKPAGELRIIEPRRQGVIYEIDHVGKEFFIRTNLDAPDFRLMNAPDVSPDSSNWTEFVAQEPGHYLSHFEIFETFVAVDIEDEDGMRIRAFGFPYGREIPVPRPAEIGVASSSFPNDNEANLQPASTVLRFRFSGPLQPECIYDFDVLNGSVSLRKQDRAISWFNPNQYVVDRRCAIASDGETVPITIVYRKDLRRAAGNPVLIMGYGARLKHAVNLYDVCC
jgi:oligopeptidase B